MAFLEQSERYDASQSPLAAWLLGIARNRLRKAYAASEPWDYTRSELAADPELQRRLYEGFFRAWYGNPNLGGFMIWSWEPGDGGPADKGYTPENKPAEKVLRDWLAKPWNGK